MTDLIKSIQTALGVAADGEVGAETLAAMAVRVDADVFPLTVKLNGQPTIIAKDLVVCNPRSGLRYYANSLSGSFSYQRNPCSILVSWGDSVCSSACHAWLGQPESVIYRTTSGKFGLERCKSSSELPDDVQWAIGGMGLLDNYDPAAEGFTGAYSDVLRRTNHTALGVKNNMVYLMYCANMTGQKVNAHCQRLGMDMAIMLDGGHVAGINGAEPYAKINTSQVQYYMLQGV